MTDSNNGVSLMQSGSYDGISASGDATTRLIQGGLVAPIDTSLLSNYADVFPGLKDLPHNTVDGVNYGTPHGRGPNLLMYNTDEVTTAPTSWDPVWEGGADYAGKISIYDSSIYIADAALHLMTKNPDLGITNPYQLNEEQFNAAIDAAQSAKGQQPAVLGPRGRSGLVVHGRRRRRRHVLAVPGEPAHRPITSPSRRCLPDEGSTGWSDTWMMSSHGSPSELHAPVDEPHDVARGERPGDGLVRRGSGHSPGMRGGRGDQPRPLRADARRRTRPTSRRSGTGARRRRTAPTTTQPPPARPRMTGSRRGPPFAAADPQRDL